MSVPSTSPHLDDIIEGIERVRQALGDMHLDAFKIDSQKQWLVERGIEIISEASRRLSDEVKARHSEIPWPKVAGIGNVLRHNYENISPPLMWKLVKEDLPDHERACREELARA